MDHFQQVLSALKSHQDIEQLPNKSPEVMGLALKQHIFDLDQLSFPVLEPLLDKILDWTDKNLLDQTFPFSLLEDLMDLMVQEDVELLFDYIESRHDRLTKNLDPGFRTGKSIIILRMCNELLRRFSKTNSPTAGRIRVYLASITPLGERSGVNLGGQFIEEETVYEKLETNDPDALFYQRFWQCQEYFNAPSTFFERIDKALIDFDTILKRFQSMPQHKSTSTGFFSSRYLTSYKLFKLEMQSPSFRDQWILQLLILLQFARMFTQQEMEQLKPVISNNSVNYKYQMTPLQESKVIELSHQAELLLEPKFRKTILQVMKSEKKWAKWKLSGCPPFDAPVVQFKDPYVHPPIASRACDPHDLGSEDMTQLWKQGQDLEDVLLTNQKRSRVQPLDEYMVELDQQLELDGSTLKDGYEPFELLYDDYKWTWIGFRRAVSEQLYLFQHPIDPEKPSKSLLKEWRRSKGWIQEEMDQSSAASVMTHSEYDPADVDQSVVDNPMDPSETSDKQETNKEQDMVVD